MKQIGTRTVTFLGAVALLLIALFGRGESSRDGGAGGGQTPKERHGRSWHLAMAFVWFMGLVGSFVLVFMFIEEPEMERSPGEFQGELQECAASEEQQGCLGRLLPDIAALARDGQAEITPQSALFFLVFVICGVGVVRRCIGAYRRLTYDHALEADPWYGDHAAAVGVSLMLIVGFGLQGLTGVDTFNAAGFFITLLLTVVCLEPVKDWIKRPYTLRDAARHPRVNRTSETLSG